MRWDEAAAWGVPLLPEVIPSGVPCGPRWRLMCSWWPMAFGRARWDGTESN